QRLVSPCEPDSLVLIWLREDDVGDTVAFCSPNVVPRALFKLRAQALQVLPKIDDSSRKLRPSGRAGRRGELDVLDDVHAQTSQCTGGGPRLVEVQLCDGDDATATRDDQEGRAGRPGPRRRYAGAPLSSRNASITESDSANG